MTMKNTLDAVRTKVHDTEEYKVVIRGLSQGDVQLTMLFNIALEYETQNMDTKKTARTKRGQIVDDKSRKRSNC